MRHGYTNLTKRVSGGVLKSYVGPDAAARADSEWTALTRLAHIMPVPAVVERHNDGSILTEYCPGDHGQELIDAGHAAQVLASCGALLRRLHAVDPGLLLPGDHSPNDVVVHGDFGPNNILLDPHDYAVTALLDWEFCAVGPAIGDIAWCEWIVRMHHPASVGSLSAFFGGYGKRPPWNRRQRAMVDRCRWLEGFARRWDPGGDGVRMWRERARVTAGWSE